MKSGKRAGSIRFPGTTDDIAFDKRGYLHAHFNPGFYMQGVGRFDPDRPAGEGRVEVPYDYGVAKSGRRLSHGWRAHATGGEMVGILPVRDQPGAKFFQDGIGVNVRGDVAEICNIYYVPKMEDRGWNIFKEGMAARGRLEGKLGDVSAEAIAEKLDVDRLKRQMLTIARDTMQDMLKSGEFKAMIDDSIFQAAMANLVQAPAFKQLLDEKFKTMTKYLAEEVIPKRVKKLNGD